MILCQTIALPCHILHVSTGQLTHSSGGEPSWWIWRLSQRPCSGAGEMAWLSCPVLLDPLAGWTIPKRFWWLPVWIFSILCCDEHPKNWQWLKLQLLRRMFLAKYAHTFDNTWHLRFRLLITIITAGRHSWCNLWLAYSFWSYVLSVDVNRCPDGPFFEIDGMMRWSLL